MKMNRRGFLALAATAGAGSLAGCRTSVPGIASGRCVNGKLRLGVIGTGSIARGSDIPGISTHRRIEMAAFCDVDTAQYASIKAKFPKAGYYQHWREMLDREDLDAVLVATPDHSHCLIMSEVMRRGLHLYGQKPLCRSFAQNRQLESLAASTGVVTQTGAQITAWECDRHTVELLRSGVIGTVEKVWVYSNTGIYEKFAERKWPLPTEPIPATMDWKAWLEGAPERPYISKQYTHLRWRVFRDFGSGWLGDMGTHLMLPIWMGMGLDRPVSAKASVFDCGWSADLKREFLPLFTHITWQFPGVKATGGKPFEVEWCDGVKEAKLSAAFLPEGEVSKLGKGSARPPLTAEYLLPPELEKLGKGCLWGELPIQGRVVKGSEGWLISTHYNRPPIVLDKQGKQLPMDLPGLEPVSSHYHEFVDCCLDGGKATTDFSMACKVTDWLLLGRAAINRPGQSVAMSDCLTGKMDV